MLSTEPLRERLTAGQQLLGSFVIEAPVRAVVEAYATAGFDFVVLDLEHSVTSLERISHLIAASRSVGLGSIVRIPAGALERLTAILDMHPDGVMVPGVQSAAQAREVVELSRFHPDGRRGLAPLLRHTRTVGSDFAALNQRTIVAVQIEGMAAAEEAAAIAGVGGVDLVFVGPYDLSQALGIPGRLTDPRLFEVAAEIGARVTPPTRLGVYVAHPADVGPWREVGASVFTASTDGQLFLAACRETAEIWHHDNET